MDSAGGGRRGQPIVVVGTEREIGQAVKTRLLAHRRQCSECKAAWPSFNAAHIEREITIHAGGEGGSKNRHQAGQGQSFGDRAKSAAAIKLKAKGGEKLQSTVTRNKTCDDGAPKTDADLSRLTSVAVKYCHFDLSDEADARESPWIILSSKRRCPPGDNNIWLGR